MYKGNLRLWLVAGSSLVLSATFALSSAPMAAGQAAAVSNHWRVAQIVGPPRGVTYPRFFVTTGPDDAWSWWGCSPTCGRGESVPGTLVKHWNGTRWSAEKMPRSANIIGVAASSARNLWAFGTTRQFPPTSDFAVTWTGSWRVRGIPNWVIRFSRAGEFFAVPAVLSPRNVWVFSVGQFYAVYNGRIWFRKHLPAQFAGQVTVVSANDVWATGIRPGGLAVLNQVLMHWNGHSWRTVTIPRPSRIPANSSEYVNGLVATSPHDVWVARYIQVGSQGARTLYLLHWDGRGWHRVNFRFPTSFVDDMSRDGRGGLWLVSNGAPPRYRWFFDHLLPSGGWTRQAAPRTAGAVFGQASVLSWIPGTSSLWAAGNLDPVHNSNVVLGALFKYGP